MLELTDTVLRPPADVAALREYIVEYLVSAGCSDDEISDVLHEDTPAALRAAGDWVYQCLTAKAELAALRRRTAFVGRWVWLAPMLFLLAAAGYVLAPLLPPAVQVLLTLGITVSVFVGLVRLWFLR